MNKRPFILSFLISVLFIFGLLTPFISRDAVDAKMQHPLLSQTELFVVNTSEECEPYETTLCFFNHESLDELDGEGTGLRAAIKHAKENLLSGIKINIVADYKIKTFPVLIDFPVVINGFDNAKITTQEPNCDHAMLNIIESVTIQNLIIDDGACHDVSRDLIVVNYRTVSRYRKTHWRTVKMLFCSRTIAVISQSFLTIFGTTHSQQ